MARRDQLMTIDEAIFIAVNIAYKHYGGKGETEVRILREREHKIKNDDGTSKTTRRSTDARAGIINGRSKKSQTARAGTLLQANLRKPRPQSSNKTI
jgi:hypothetical protein